MPSIKSGIMVRLEDTGKQYVEDLANDIGLTPTDIMRIGLALYIKEVEINHIAARTLSKYAKVESVAKRIAEHRNKDLYADGVDITAEDYIAAIAYITDN